MQEGRFGILLLNDATLALGDKYLLVTDENVQSHVVKVPAIPLKPLQ